jgi:transposase
MNQKVYVGIDLAKDSSRVAVVDEDGSKLLSPFSIKNTKEGMEKLLSKLSSYKNDQILCGMEASLQTTGKTSTPTLRRKRYPVC